MIRGVAPLIVAVLAIAGCGQSEGSSQRGALENYLARVEPIRLQVNRLLGGADPILSAYSDHRLDATAAQHRMGQLERRFAAYAVKIAALHPVPAELRAAQASYAHTFVFEDAYLSALVSALPERSYDDLPDTQSQQRATITAWRIRLEVLAKRLRVQLPSNIQTAGRGEIAPSPSGS